jgi:leucyl-tRNA synthetase
MSDQTPFRYDPQAVEAKWQARWAESGTNEPDLDRAARPYYNLMMFPYPSAEGLHVGNMFAFTGSDAFGRYKRLQGFDVFEPIGFDAFGIHSENYALKMGVHPAELIPANITNFRRQLTRIGGMFSWRHVLSTTDPAYYKWTQWLFLQLYKAGKAYRKYGTVNWCPECKTVLANEQVINGFCERHPDTKVEQRALEQWYFRIAEYAERLLADLDDRTKMDWSDTTATAQRNWLGRSEGAEIDFAVEGDCGAIRVYTTRPDTLYGATFMVLAPEHPLVPQLVGEAERPAVEAYRAQVASQDLVSRKVGDKEKTGVFTGAYAVNPATGGRIPVWIADYVLMEYGTGAIMAVPAHDERDFDFARKFGLPVTRVLAREGQPADAPMTEAETDTEGYVLVHSGPWDGRPAREALAAVTAWLEQEGHGKGVVRYRIYDWCISRQRYWGPPIPMIYCPTCGPVPVPERDLPVLLPPIEDFRPDDSGVSPLARHEEWYFVPCPACGQRARRETDVSDTFLDSAWYYLRYPSTEFEDRPFDPERTRRWCPVAMYIGGNEHAVLHLLYSRFIAMVLHDLGHLAFDEPFRTFRAHGLIVKDGAKMSKSRGNVVIPDEYIARWGADTFRLYLMFLGPFQEGGDFRDSSISGPRRFLDKVWDLVAQCENVTLAGQEVQQSVVVKRHQTVKKVTEAMEALSYNTAIAALMELLNVMRETNCSERHIVKDLVVMLAPFAPHFSEECWERLGARTTVFSAKWPAWDERLTLEDLMEIPVQVNGKTRGKVRVPRGAEEAAIVAAAVREDAVRRFTEGKELRKQIYVPGRLLNLVVG